MAKILMMLNDMDRQKGGRGLTKKEAMFLLNKAAELTLVKRNNEKVAAAAPSTSSSSSSTSSTAVISGPTLVKTTLDTAVPSATPTATPTHTAPAKPSAPLPAPPKSTLPPSNTDVDDGEITSYLTNNHSSWKT